MNIIKNSKIKAFSYIFVNHLRVRIDANNNTASALWNDLWLNNDPPTRFDQIL